MSTDFSFWSPTVAPKKKRPGLRLMALFLAVASATCALLVLGEKVGQAREARRERLPLEALLQNGVGRTRPLPARLFGFRYAEYRNVEKDSEADWKAWKRRVKQGTEEGKRGGQQLRVEALLALLEKDEADALRPALLRLETAVSHPSAPASDWSDLAAIRYSTARLWNEPYLVLEALENAEQALDRDASLPEALFNRALCLEALGLWRHALETWDAYLRVDPSSGWAAEARRHRAEIRLPDPEAWPKEELESAALRGDRTKVEDLVREYRSPSRRLLEEEILRDWGKARLASDPSAASLLLAAKTLAAAYQTLAGDALYSEAVAALERAAGNAAEPQDILDLAAAHEKFALAVEAIDETAKSEDARRHLEAALPLFHGHASPFLWRAELKLAIVEQREAKHAECIDRLVRLREKVGDRSYPNLLGESFFVEGTSLGRINRPELAGDSLEKALRLFKTAGERENQTGIYSMLAEERDISGQRGEAWELLAQSLSSAAEIYSSRRLYQVYAAAGTSAWTAGYPRISLLFWNELQPWTLGNPKQAIESRLWQARILHVLGEDELAGTRLAEARQGLSALAEGDRGFLEASIQVVEGELAMEEDPAAAVAHLQAARARYAGLGELVWERAVLLELARAQRRLGDSRAARETLHESLSLTEKQRLELDEKDRATLLQTEAGAFAELIDLEFDAGNRELALLYNERRLARSLLDRFAAEAPESIQDLTRRLPPDLTLIEYASIKGRWLAWAISAKGVRGVELPPQASGLAPDVSRWVGNIQRRTPLESLQDDAGALYRTLIAPLGPLEGDWVIIPDGPLKDLPFAALFDGESLVVEKRAASASPSAAFFIAVRRQNRDLAATSPLVPLVVGNPDLEGSGYPWLAPLPQSEDEASGVAQRYGVAPLLGSNATRERFLARIQDSEILHFSGHAVTRPESPQDSALILAGGNLTARDIQARKLPRTRLAVLGACSTATGPSLGGEGAESLARAFHAAGVPGVVASLWDVSDLSTSELMGAFHGALLAGGDARQALRKAQLHLLHHADPKLHDPAAWAAFQLIGEASFPVPRP